MLVKVSRDPNSTLHSDIEEKGKGKRIKKPKKQYDAEIIETNILDKGRLSILPPIPKFTPVTNTSSLHLNENKENQLHLSKHAKKPLTDRQLSNIKDSSKEDNINYTNKRTRDMEEFYINKKVCKMNPKVHTCAYASDGTVSLQSIANSICSLSSMLILSLLYLFAFCKSGLKNIFLNL